MSEGVWTLDEAKSAFDAMLERVRSGEPQVITSNGEAVAVLSKPKNARVSAADDYTGEDEFLEFLFSIPQGGDIEFKRIEVKPRPVEF